MSLWQPADVEKALGVYGLPQFIATGVSIDTRTLEKGDMFVALSDQTDGHAYVAAATQKGAAAVVVSRLIEGVDIPQVLVPDTQKALEQLGRYARERATRLKSVAITGSSGKTSTKEMLAAALKAHRSVASYNNHFGVPLTLARMPADTAYGVFEIGMNHAGEIAPLAQQVQPHIALVTNVGTAHLGNLGSVEAIRVEKLSIAQSLPEGGLLIVPHDLDTAGIPAHVQVLRFGGEGSDAVATQTLPQGDGWKVWAIIRGENVVFDVPHPGVHQVTNALAALLAAHVAGEDLGTAALRLSRAEVMSGRGKVYHVGGAVVIDDSYNANPSSMAAALQTLVKRPATRRIAVLGDMLELGDMAEAYHKGLVTECDGVDSVMTVGLLSEVLQNNLPPPQQGGHFTKQDDVALSLHAGDVILVKGSNGIGLSHFVDRLLTAHNGKTKHAV